MSINTNKKKSKDLILKIIYIIDNDLSPFLSRSLNPVPVQYFDMTNKNILNDDYEENNMIFGYVSFTKIYDLLALSSPEMFNDQNNDYNVYYRDILENKEPYVSCGLMSEVQDNMEIMGRVVKNFSGIVRTKGNCNDILEVKLKFSKVHKSPVRSLINKHSPISKLTKLTKETTKKKSNTNNKSSIMRKIMEKDNFNSTMNNSFLESSPQHFEYNSNILSSGLNSNSLNDHQFSSSSNNSNIKSGLSSMDDYEDYSDVDKRFDFIKMKKNKVSKKKKLQKLKKEKENFIPVILDKNNQEFQYMNNPSDLKIKSTKGLEFDLNELLDDDIYLPKNTEKSKLSHEIFDYERALDSSPKRDRSSSISKGRMINRNKNIHLMNSSPKRTRNKNIDIKNSSPKRSKNSGAMDSSPKRSIDMDMIDSSPKSHKNIDLADYTTKSDKNMELLDSFTKIDANSNNESGDLDLLDSKNSEFFNNLNNIGIDFNLSDIIDKNIGITKLNNNILESELFLDDIFDNKNTDNLLSNDINSSPTRL